MPRNTQVHKFGGASLATAEAMAHAVSIVLAHRSAPIVVVVAALAGVTDALLDIATKGLRSGGGATALRRKHSALARALLTGARRKELISRVDETFAELKVPRKMTPAATDSLLVRGGARTGRVSRRVRLRRGSHHHRRHLRARLGRSAPHGTRRPQNARSPPGPRRGRGRPRVHWRDPGRSDHDARPGRVGPDGDAAGPCPAVA